MRTLTNLWLEEVRIKKKHHVEMLIKTKKSKVKKIKMKKMMMMISLMMMVLILLMIR